MTVPSRLLPLLEQFDFAYRRLADRMTGPLVDSGDGADTPVGPMTDDEYFWEPVPGCWSVRRRGLRADHTVGGRRLTRDDYRVGGDAATATAAFGSGAEAWRKALLSADDTALDTVGYCAYPHGGDPEEPFLDVVWWVNQELLHHGAEIALLRDLYQARARTDAR
ncbi:DinB family protein [Streptomyces eurythermus]|uniref:DinB family protein n=1 Tax=Streptomyces eurythermus TaxID=42237 RepID=UPI0033E2735F